LKAHTLRVRSITMQSRVAAGVAALMMAIVACGGVAPTREGPARAPITLLLVGDVMLGREVAPIAAADPAGLFEDVRLVVRRADLALANLESPLTSRPHVSPNPNALEASPALASLVADAGFDLMSIANNHSGDAGPGGLLDTIAAVERSGMTVIGAGSDFEHAYQPSLFDVDGVRVAVLAFDATGAGLAATDSGAGVARWEPDRARVAVESASERSDLVVVSVHGGVEYLPEPDPRMESIAEDLAGWGADVIWGHGAHVVQPVALAEGGDRSDTVVATSLGNFLFDQRGPLTGGGGVLEVLADDEGVIAYRLGSTTHRDLRAHFEDWDLPEGDSALVEGVWWSLLREPEVKSGPVATIDDFEWGTVIAASTGRITDSDRDEIVVSFRHIPGAHPVRDGLSDIDWLDANGMSPHLGIYDAGDLTPIWVAGMVPAPVAGIAACDGSIALAYSTLDDTEVIATGAAIWRPGGLDAVDSLPGPGAAACADVDGDGVTEPVILERS
jgi:poly-gamma-glutamate synthesis protein (capsule biosynthesis protein)